MKFLLVARSSWLFARCSLLIAHCSLLSTCCSLLCPRYFFVQHLWATARLLVTGVSLIFLVERFFILSFLVLLMKMTMRVESKILSCFCVWCKSRELEGRGCPEFPCVILVVESFCSGFLRAIVSYWSESHLVSCQT